MYSENTKNSLKHKWYLLLLLPIIFGVLGYAVMLLWNATLPQLFVVFPTITFWQATGLLVLCRILFGSFKFGMQRHHDAKYHGHCTKCGSISAEEKLKFKEEWKKRCGEKSEFN